jgi:tetratricopeptide (TPR) repeat protein
MILSELEIMKKIKEAKKFQKLGNFKEAEKVYAGVLRDNENSFDLIFSYALFSKDLKNFVFAKKLLVNLTKKFPSEIRSYIQIADILTLENRYSEAEQVLLLAKKIAPNNSDVLYNFSRLYWSGKNFELSLKYINKAIELNNEIENYKIFKADILMCKDQLDESLSILNLLKNNETNNKQLQVINLISQIHIKKKNFKKAEDILIEMIKNYKNLELGYLNLSNLYVLTKELDKGIKTIKKGLSISPNYVPFYKNLATIYKNNGQLNKAIEIHLLIIKKNKYDFNSYYELSTIYDFKDHKDDLNLLLNLNINNLNISSKIYASFALSNIFHKKQKYEKSAYFLKIANDESLKQCESSYGLRINNAEFIRSLNIKKQRCKSTKNAEQLIFIVGMPRSGSTLLENILSLNNKVVDMGEIDFLEESIKEIKDIKDVFTSYKTRISKKFKAASCFTDKNLFNFVYCGVIYRYFPNAKIIHCMRNPLDNILSMYRTNFRNQSFTYSLTDIANFYVYHFNIMKEHKEHFGDIIFEYCYEELVKNPKVEIPKIINWLGWEWDDAYLAPHKNKRNVFTASSSQVRKKIYSSSIKVWEEYQELLKPAIDIIRSNKYLKKRIY